MQSRERKSLLDSSSDSGQDAFEQLVTKEADPEKLYGDFELQESKSGLQVRGEKIQRVSESINTIHALYQSINQIVD